MRSFSFAKLLVIGFVIATIVRIWFVQIYEVGGDSMSPTLLNSERVLVQKIDTALRRGDLVVIDANQTFEFQLESSPGEKFLRILGFETLDKQLVVKRVIAVGGDTLQCCDESGRLILNGKPLIEGYLAERASADEFNVQVTDGHVWVMGDNRDNSRDSRDLLGQPGGGMIPDTKIIGKVHSVIWPPARIRSLN
ncbi:MAG: signal peptidase [Actinomycetota bacterium]